MMELFEKFSALLSVLGVLAAFGSGVFTINAHFDRKVSRIMCAACWVRVDTPSIVALAC